MLHLYLGLLDLGVHRLRELLAHGPPRHREAADLAARGRFFANADALEPPGRDLLDDEGPGEHEEAHAEREHVLVEGEGRDAEELPTEVDNAELGGERSKSDDDEQRVVEESLEDVVFFNGFSALDFVSGSSKFTGVDLVE